MTRRAASVRDQRDVRGSNRGVRVLGRIMSALQWVCLALVISIIIEWIGISSIWAGQGANHSREILREELGYLNSDFKEWITGTPPAHIARQTANFAYRWVVVETGIETFIKWVTPARRYGESPESRRMTFRRYYLFISDYVLAAIHITQLFAVRITIAALSMPAFIMLGAVGLVEGLVQRDLRRFGGGLESGFVYHEAKKFIAPAVAVAWVVYLALPVSLHPNWIFLPAALSFALAIMITAATFKKFL